MTNETEVYIALKGDDFDPADITALIGIKPTSFMKKNNPIPKCSQWIYSSGRIKNDVIDIYDISKKLILNLVPYKENIKVIKNKFDLTIVLEVVVWITMDSSISTPAIGFDSEVISFLNYIEASIDIDTYRI
jgi:hypothetical protein